MCPQMGLYSPVTQARALPGHPTGDLSLFAGQHPTHWATLVRAVTGSVYIKYVYIYFFNLKITIFWKRLILYNNFIKLYFKMFNGHYISNILFNIIYWVLIEYRIHGIGLCGDSGQSHSMVSYIKAFITNRLVELSKTQGKLRECTVEFIYVSIAPVYTSR